MRNVLCKMPQGTHERIGFLIDSDPTYLFTMAILKQNIFFD
jgi:hypothetical protein